MSNEYIPDYDSANFYSTVYNLQSAGASHSRTIYGLLAFIGDLGGVTEVVMLMFGFFLYPISEFEFYIEAMSQLFMARTSDDTLMDTQCQSFCKKPDFKIAKSQMHEINLHK